VSTVALSVSVVPEDLRLDPDDRSLDPPKIRIFERPKSGRIQEKASAALLILGLQSN